MAAAIAGDLAAAESVHLVLPETGICQDQGSRGAKWRTAAAAVRHRRHGRLLQGGRCGQAGRQGRLRVRTAA